MFCVCSIKSIPLFKRLPSVFRFEPDPVVSNDVKLPQKALVELRDGVAREAAELRVSTVTVVETSLRVTVSTDPRLSARDRDRLQEECVVGGRCRAGPLVFLKKHENSNKGLTLSIMQVATLEIRF